MLTETYVEELSLRDTITVNNDSGGLEASVAVELDKQLANHVGEIGDDLLTVLLDTNSGRISEYYHMNTYVWLSNIPARMSIHTSDDSSDGRLSRVSSRWMSYVTSEEDDWFVEDAWTNSR